MIRPAEFVLHSQVSLPHWWLPYRQSSCTEYYWRFRRRRSKLYQLQGLEEQWFFWIWRNMRATWMQRCEEHRKLGRRAYSFSWWLSSFWRRPVLLLARRTSCCRQCRSSIEESCCMHRRFSNKSFDSCQMCYGLLREHPPASPRNEWFYLHS